MKGRAPLVVAVLTLGVHVAIASRYGWFRDELYFLACGRRLDWGYVDQPPLIALISRVAFALSGGHLALYRFPAALAHAATVFLAGRFAERCGGGALLAALAVAVAPIFAVEGHLLTMNAFEPLLYLSVVLLMDRIVRQGEERLWPSVGALTGIALLNKHSFVFYAACLLLGILLTPGRRALASRGLVIALGLATLIVLPHAVWQARAGFPMVELLAAQPWKNASWSLRDFVVQQVLEVNPVAVAVGAAGFVLVWREQRYAALAFLLQIALFAALKGKAYYVAAAWLPMLAAGGAAVKQRFRPAAAVAVAASGAALLPLVLPVLSPARLERYQADLGVSPPKLENKRYGALPQHLADMFGWEELRDAVAEAARQLPPGERAAVFTQNYGEAGALELFGSAGLPVISGHNSYWRWGAPADLTALLIVGGRVEDHRRAFAECREAARERDAPWAMPYERALPVWLCRTPRKPVSALWPRVKHYD
jgi:hypothetical protein